MSSRSEIDEICRAHDELLRKATIAGEFKPSSRLPPVRPKAENPRRQRPEPAPVPPPPPTLNAAALLEDPLVVEAIGAALAHERKRAREERREEISALEKQIAELRGQVSTLLALLGKENSKVVDLPTWRQSA
jgi:hypothetical protein